MSDKRKEKKTEYKKYSDHFKRMVVDEYERGSENISAIQRKYHITGGSTLSSWLRKYGKSSTYPTEVRIEMKGESMRKDAKIKDLEKQLKQLKEVLADEVLGRKCVEAEFLAWKHLLGEKESTKIEKKSQNIMP